MGGIGVALNGDVSVDTDSAVKLDVGVGVGVGGAVERLTGGSRRKIYRLPRRRLLLLLFACGLALMVLLGCIMASGISWHATVSGRASMHYESLAKRLEREVRVLCWVMTTPENHKVKAVHVQRTWGRRCNSIYFVTSQADDELKTIVFNLTDSYDTIWGKTKAAFKYIHEHLRDEADWYMKADDDTYVFVENLRYMLYPYGADWPIYFGFNFKMLEPEKRHLSYMSGGSGYVLSREALRLFVEEGLTDPTKCRQDNDSAEDIEMGVCLNNVGVYAGDSRDDKLKHRFQPFAPYTTLISGYDNLDFWYFEKAFYNPRPCIDCLSEYPVAFHYVAPEEFYVYEYFNYEFEALGLPQPQSEQLPTKLTLPTLFIPPSDNLD